MAGYRNHVTYKLEMVSNMTKETRTLNIIQMNDSRPMKGYVILKTHVSTLISTILLSLGYGNPFIKMWRHIITTIWAKKCVCPCTFSSPLHHQHQQMDMSGAIIWECLPVSSIARCLFVALLVYVKHLKTLLNFKKGR